jgi:CheY-like chemotaxis protein
VAAELPRVGRSGKENRQYRRLPFAVDVLVNRAVLMKAIDISEGGLYVHTGRSFTPGSIVEVELPLGAQKITVKGTVQHNQNGVGIGVKFLDLSAQHRSAILDFIQNSGASGRRVGGSRQRLLIIDEDAMKRRMSKSKLIHEGFSIVEVEDGSEAIRRMEEETPDLVILDLFLQKADGFKVLSAIKESPKWKDIPVLVYSSKGGGDLAERALAAGAAVFLLKMTTTPAKLAEIVKRTLSP